MPEPTRNTTSPIDDLAREELAAFEQFAKDVARGLDQQGMTCDRMIHAMQAIKEALLGLQRQDGATYEEMQVAGEALEAEIEAATADGLEAQVRWSLGVKMAFESAFNLASESQVAATGIMDTFDVPKLR